MTGQGAPVVVVASGKGGVGKSTFVANVAVALAQKRKRVLVIDADFSLANLDVLLGLAPARTAEHFFGGHASLEEIAVDGPAGIRVVPAASGITDLTRFSRARRESFVRGLERLRLAHDFVWVDAPAGIGENVVQLARCADRALVVASPEPTSLVDAYATIKVFEAAIGIERVSLLVNGARDAQEARGVHAQIDRVCTRFLGAGVDLAGIVLHDPCVPRAVRAQQVVVASYPACAAARCFRLLAEGYAAQATPCAERPSSRWDALLHAGEGVVH